MQLKDLLKGIDNAAEIEKAIKDNLKNESCKLFIDDGKDNIYVPKSRLDDKIKELKSANDTISNLNGTIDDLKAGDNENNAETIKNLKKQIKEHEGKLQQVQLDNAIETFAKDHKAKDVKDLQAFLDMTKVSLDTNGQVLGLKEQVDELVKSKPYLFNTEEQPGSAGPFGTGNPGKPSNTYIFGSKTMHEGDFGKALAQQGNPKKDESNQVDSDYFFK